MYGDGHSPPPFKVVGAVAGKIKFVAIPVPSLISYSNPMGELSHAGDVSFGSLDRNKCKLDPTILWTNKTKENRNHVKGLFMENFFSALSLPVDASSRIHETMGYIMCHNYSFFGSS